MEHNYLKFPSWSTIKIAERTCIGKSMDLLSVFFFHQQHFTETSASEEAIMIIPETLAVASAMNLDNENPFEVESDIEDGDASFLELERRTETMISDNDPSLCGPPPFGYRTFNASASTTYRRLFLLQNNQFVASFYAGVFSMLHLPGVKTPTAVLDAQFLLDSLY